MEGFSGTQYYPQESISYVDRVQNVINAYYENDTGSAQVGADTAADDVERLSTNLSTFPKCVNEFVDKMLVAELAQGLPQDDIDDLTVKHDRKCTEALDAVRKAIKAIETYSAMTGIIHLFTKEETDELTDDKTLSLIVRVIIDMYGEEQISAEEYITNLKNNRQKLDEVLLSLSYE